MLPDHCATGASPYTIDCPPTSERLIESTEIRFSEIIAALSVALDITQGHPEGHCMRTALVGMRLAEELRLSAVDRSALFYALLLKDLGCSSNAAKITYLFGADDHLVKRSVRVIDWTKAGPSLKHCWTHCAPGGSLIEKLLKMAAMARSGAEGARKISEVRCERGADIARMLRLPEATSVAIRNLDEHWDGNGQPYGTAGQAIPLLGRICCLAQTVEVFFTTYGLESAIDVARQRRGEWFDPHLVDALEACQGDAGFWSRLLGDDLVSELSCWEPEDTLLLADDACLDRVAEAFAKVVDAKSPWTFQHSTRVADIAVGISQQFGCTLELQRDIRRAGLLHDIGKLGVSNLILDKPGKPTEEEFAQIRKHPDFSLQILQQVGAFQTLADVASAHHERLDGRGYHRRIGGQQLPWVARVLAVADIYEAMSAKRPYRDAMSWDRIQQIMGADAGSGVDPECLAGLERWLAHTEMASRVEAQLNEVDRLVAEL
jgi:putative nucleotidyltransferase with HDIG domain